MAALLNRLSGSHTLIAHNCCVADPLSYSETPFCRAFADIVKAGQIGFVLLLLGTISKENPGLQIQFNKQAAEQDLLSITARTSAFEQVNITDFDFPIGNFPHFCK